MRKLEVFVSCCADCPAYASHEHVYCNITGKEIDRDDFGLSEEEKDIYFCNYDTLFFPLHCPLKEN